MKIIIAPSKTMKIQKTNIPTRPILFKEENDYLHRILKDYNDEQIISLMKISPKQAEKVMNYFQDDQTYPALFLYSGTVFKQLHLDRYNEDDFTYISNHLNIMSAYYGVLEYNSAITHYRLDMNMKPNHINLYDYWYEDIYEYFKDEDFIISLASKEFNKMIHHPDLIFIDFIIYKNNRPTRNGMLVKKARGQMLNYMITHKITTIDEIKDITFDDYHYDEELSDDHTLAFTKKL